MKGQLLSILLIVFLSFVGAVGDYFLKLAGNGEKYINVRYFLIGFLIFASTSIGWFFVFKKMKFATAGVVYGISMVLFLAVIGAFFLNERLNFYEVTGVVCKFKIMSVK